MDGGSFNEKKQGLTTKTDVIMPGRLKQKNITPQRENPA
jgi:hypothetical protein